MKALVVLAQPPTLEGNAPGRCAVGLLRGLAHHGVDVTAVAARQFFAGDDPVPGDLDVEVVDVQDETRAWGGLDRLRHPQGNLRGVFSDRVRALAADADLVHLEETGTAWCDVGIDKPSSVSIHYRSHRDRRMPFPWQQEFRLLVEQAAAETIAARRHSFLVANSTVVARSLRRVNRAARIVVSPLSLDPAAYEIAPLDGPPVAGLIGAAYWPPTRAAILRLTERVWPEVRRRVPEARLVVAGLGTGALATLQAEANGIDFVGEVESAAAFIRSLSLMLYPAERGSGMKVKVLEAMASGVPVVTTANGAEGIAPAEGVIVCETDEELVSAAVEVLQGRDRRVGLGRAAREVFEARFSPFPATEPLAELFAEMAAAAG